jgi:outer membrane protein assembly factor BamD (BamD/ComL family)
LYSTHLSSLLKKIYNAIAINNFFCQQAEKSIGLLQIKLQKLTFYRYFIYIFYKNSMLHNYRKLSVSILVFLLTLASNKNLSSETDKQITLPFPSENSINKIEKEIEIEVIQPSKASTLPNQSDPSGVSSPKKKKSEKAEDPHLGIYPRGMYQLNRSETDKALVDLNQATSSEGGNTNLAKLEIVRLLAKERKTAQAKTMLDGIDDLDTRYKGYFELASGLDNISTTKQEREESIPLFLQIITEAPREMISDKKSKDKTKDDEPQFNPLLPKTRWALANVLFKSEEFTPALDHLSRIIIEFPKSEYLDDAIYLSGKIHEVGNQKFPRDTKRAIKYYQIFLKKKDQEPFKSSIYLSEIEKRVKQITPNLKPFAIQ